LRILVIYNPIAGHRRANKLLPQVKSYLQQKGIDFELRLTNFSRHGLEITRDAEFDRYDGIVAAGGDGTLFEVINGYFKNQSPKRIPLGVLPIGTGNAMARDLNLTNKRWHEAIDIIFRNQFKKIDVGHFLCEGQSFYYLNILGLGFVADVIDIAHKLKIFGNLSYTLGVFFRTIFLNSHHLTIEIDGKVLERENIFVEISNTRYTANFFMAPNAKIDDGLLDITLLNKLSRRRLLQCFPKIFTGEHLLMEEVESFQAKKIQISTPTPKVLTPDGELIGATPVEVECLTQALDVFWS